MQKIRDQSYSIRLFIMSVIDCIAFSSGDGLAFISTTDSKAFNIFAMLSGVVLPLVFSLLMYELLDHKGCC